MSWEPSKYVNTLTEKQKRMVEDDEFFNVTSEEVRAFLLRASHIFTREEMIRFRIKYAPWIADREKRFMDELGLDYENHTITWTSSVYGKTYLVNGYTATQWKMLTQDDYFPGRSSVSFFINLCRDRNDEAALQILMLKYGHIYETANAQILTSQGIPADTPYQTLTRTHIDGMSFFLWKLLNDDNFVPISRGILVSAIRRLRSNNEDAIAEFIENKYNDFLYPDRMDPITAQEIAEAEDYFRKLFPFNDKL